MTTAGPYRLLHFDSLTSTMDEAMARLKAGAAGNFVISASTQTGGRGRQGRTWVSPRGNLYASLALRDPAEVALAPQLGFVGGVALARTLRARLAGDARLQLKWPNDALHAGAKVAGLLLECSSLPDGRFGCVMGIGINCTSHPDGLAYPATSLRQIGVSEVEPGALLAELAVNIEIELKRWDRGAGFPDVRAGWLELAAGLGGPMTLATARGMRAGTFRGLDETGRLLLETAAGLEAVDAGDVLLAAATPDLTR